MLVKNSCGSSQFCTPNNTVPVSGKIASYLASADHFSPFLLIRFLQNRPSSYRSMAGPAKKTGGEREDTNYDPEEEEKESSTPKKGRKKKEKPDPGLTMGTDIENVLQPDGKQVEIQLSKVRIDQEKTKQTDEKGSGSRPLASRARMKLKDR